MVLGTVSRQSLHFKAAPFTLSPAWYHVLDSPLESIKFYEWISSLVSRTLAEVILKHSFRIKILFSLVQDTLNLFASATSKQSYGRMRLIRYCTLLMGTPGLCVASDAQHCFIMALCPPLSSFLYPYCSSFMDS